MRRKIILLISGLISCFAIIFGVSAYRPPGIESWQEEIVSKIDTALDSKYKKQSMTELTTTIAYVNTAKEENKIYYHILKTTFFEGDPANIIGLHIEALSVLFPVELMDSCMEMKIQNRNAALYKKDDIAYLCWTYQSAPIKICGGVSSSRTTTRRSLTNEKTANMAVFLLIYNAIAWRRGSVLPCPRGGPLRLSASRAG